MSAQDLLRRLDDLGVALTLADDRIRYRGRGDALPADLLAEMKTHRDDLVDLLARREGLAWPPVPADEPAGPLTAAQRSLAASGTSAAVVASLSRVASSLGNGTPAFGGRDDSRNARTTRPTSSATVMSANH